MAQEIENPGKSFQFAVLAAGLLNYAVQDVTGLETEFDQVEHGGARSDIKTAGKQKFPNIKLEKLRPIGVGDNWIWDWLEQVKLGLPQGYKRNIDIVQYANDGITITDLWEVTGVWPVKLNGIELSRTKSENSMESIELSVDEWVKVI